MEKGRQRIAVQNLHVVLYNQYFLLPNIIVFCKGIRQNKPILKYLFNIKMRTVEMFLQRFCQIKDDYLIIIIHCYFPIEITLESHIIERK